MSDWGLPPEDDTTRRLRQALHDEAARVRVTDRFDQLRGAAMQDHGARRSRTPWLVAAAVVVALVVGVGYLLTLTQQGTLTSAAPAGERARDSAPGTEAARTTATTASGDAVGFATPRGDIACRMGDGEVLCFTMSATEWEQATPRQCRSISDDTASATYSYDMGGVLLTAKGAELVCGTQAPVGLVVGSGDPAVSWYDPTLHRTVDLPWGAAPVLPYGGVATTTGGQRCEVSELGVRCTDASNGAILVAHQQVALVTPGTVPVRYVVASGDAAFVSGDATVRCLMTDESAECEAVQPTYQAPPRPASCQLDWGGRIGLTAQGAAFVCAGGTLAGLAAKPDLTQWYGPAYGTDVVMDGAPQAGLGVGSSISRAGRTCSVGTDGVTCTDSSGKGFTVSSSAYRLR